MSKIIGRRLSIFWDDSVVVIEKRDKASHHKSPAQLHQVKIDLDAQNPLYLENIVECWDGTEGHEPVGEPIINGYGQLIESYLTGGEYWQTEDEYRRSLTEGDSSLDRFFNTPKRPNIVNDRIQLLFGLINENNLEAAKLIVAELGEVVGNDEPELIKADASIRRREIIGR